KLDEVGVPQGYTVYTSGGRTFLRRSTANDERFAQLTVDADGVIQAGSAKSLRVSSSSRAGASVGRLLESAGLKQRPPHHQAHHLVPDEVVRKRDLLREAYERGLFDPDGPDNI